MADLEAKRAELAAKVGEARKINRQLIELSGQLELLKLDIVELSEDLEIAVQGADQK